jgi:ABC-2 type transport system ATP-binding protein
MVMSVVTDPVISAVKLNKVYRSGFGMRRVTALADVTFDVGRGEVFGFLGPNGAGKTSLIKILMGLARPTAGVAQVFGRPARDARTKSRIGFLPESPYFYEYLTATEFLGLSARLSGVTASETDRRVRNLLKLVRMEDAAGARMHGYSRGMLQRMGIAQAMISDPELVILDEPMGGLDPVGRKEFRDIIVGLRDQGKTVFFSTHILADVEMICDRVGIIIAGEMVNIGALSDILTDEVQAYEVTVTGLTGKFRKVLERVGEAAIRSGDALLVTVPDDAGVDKVTAIVREAGARIQAIVPRKRTLEDHFMAHVRGGREERR